ncbi:(2Fe-2S)-binding protein [Sporanaerobium hydrogeniformans]|uniref:(2Fe-2S)-binding protein n=1 Tax=Sporanaerobium hydrogeniformans TaxID=3072179 RepID=A0AC61DCQ5_9FIRM|nr:(2Fe-2S)-binding protein [Sporanaerobium hydrogeniformans]PHV70540.1 (2Fe-2S)-binding protein [Sporanaerobium hydrogeniformans]
MNMEDMVCTCFGITVQDIKDAIDNGATTLEEVQEVTRVGMACGSCIDEVIEVIETLTAQK